jgi:hypothetical protein
MVNHICNSGFLAGHRTISSPTLKLLFGAYYITTYPPSAQQLFDFPKYLFLLYKAG